MYKQPTFCIRRLSLLLISMHRSEYQYIQPVALALVSAMTISMSSLSAQAACTDNGGGNINCTGTSDNSVPLTGTVTLDSGSGAVTLNNQPNIPIENDRAQDTQDSISTVKTSGTNNASLNNSGTIKMDRAFVFDNLGNVVTPGVTIDTSLFTADTNGQLLNNGAAVGVAAAVSFGVNTPLITITNLVDPNPNTTATRAYYGDIRALGDFSAAIYGSSPQVVINNQASIRNVYYSYGSDTLSEGHWAIATFGAGSTIINNDSGAGLLGYASIIGDIILKDRDPLKEAAQQLAIGQGTTLELAYGASEVGPRNSVINNASGGTIQGNIYLGSGEHIINNNAGASIFGSIYIDQRAAEVTSVSGGVTTIESTVAGARKVTFTSSGRWATDGDTSVIQLNDVAGAENNFTINLGIAGADSGVSAPSVFSGSITANGLGNNTLNLGCYYEVNGLPSTCAISNATQLVGMTTVNIGGNTWDINSGARIQAGGDININSGVVNLYGDSGNSELAASNVVVNSGAALQGQIQSGLAADNIGIITGNLVNKGLVNVGNASLQISGNAIFENNSSLGVNILSATQYGNLSISGGNGSFSNSSTIIPTVKSNYYVRSGDTFTIANNTTGTPKILDKLGLVHFTSSDSSGNLVLTAQQYIAKALNPSVAAENAVAALTQITGNTLGVAQLQLDLQNASSVELKRAAERLHPETNDGAIRMVLGNTDHVLDIVQSHLFSSTLGRMRGENLGEEWMRDPDAQAGNAKGIWVQGFGYGGVQDGRRNSDGYSLNTTGFATGIDRTIGNDENLRLGAGFSYAAGNIDNSGVTDSNRMRTNSYLGLLYGTWIQQQWFVNGAIAGGRNTYNTRRVALDRVAEGQHDAWQVTGKIDTGLLLPLNSAFTFIPMAALNYTHLNESSYTETGSTTTPSSGNGVGVVAYTITPGTPIALTVDGRSFDSLRSGLGGKLLWATQQQDWHAAIDLHAMWQHEFGDLAQDSTARFVAGGNSFNSPGVKLARDSMVLGSTLRLTGDDEHDQVSLLASYDADLRDKYFGQTMSMMLRYDFDQASVYLKRAKTRQLAQANAPTVPVSATAKTISDIQQAISPKQSNLHTSSQVVANSLQDSAFEQKEQAVTKVINQWLGALINKNTDAYLNSYASEFTPPNGMSRRVWENQRKVELARDGNSAIQISYLSVTPNGNQASAVFTQAEISGGDKSTLLKSVDFIEKNGRWLIVKEDSMALPN